MKYVFLDIDGVLNSQEFFEREKPLSQFDFKEEVKDYDLGLAHMSEELVATLNGLVVPGEVAFVLSSTWRMQHPMHHVQSMLAYRGFKGHLIGCTPSTTGMRGREIAMWLMAATGALMFDRVVKNTWPDFVILDDDSDMLHLEDYLVQTDGQVGLQDADIVAAREKLGLGG